MKSNRSGAAAFCILTVVLLLASLIGCHGLPARDAEPGQPTGVATAVEAGAGAIAPAGRAPARASARARDTIPDAASVGL
jgi:hypothetical protein